MLDELGWEHAVQDIPESGLALERSASPEELEAVARSLELLGCRSLVARYALTPRGGGHVHAIPQVLLQFARRRGLLAGGLCGHDDLLIKLSL